MKSSGFTPRSPGQQLLAGVVFCVLLSCLAVFAATARPWLGLGLAPDFDSNTVRVVGARGPSHHVPLGHTVLSLESGAGAPVPLEATDLLEEPDFFDTYPEMETFFQRQTVLSAVLESNEVVLRLKSEAGEVSTVQVTPAGHRPLLDLPVVFWFQLLCGSAGFLIGLWVLLLSPSSKASRFFAGMGAMFLLFTFPAAVYSTRELALDGSYFRLLSSLNHGGAFLYGSALVGLFLEFPSPLSRSRLLRLLPWVFVPWLIADWTRLAPNQDWGSRLPILTETLLAIALAAVQFRRTRTDPRARAALRWLGGSVMVGTCLFVLNTACTSLLGVEPPVPQGYAFGFFLLMDVGLALGLRRHSLLGLDEWAFRVLSWLGAALSLLVLDLVLVFVVGASQSVSLGVSLLVCGLGYLPVRNCLWEKAVSGRRLDEHELFQGVLRAAFAPQEEDRSRLWIELLRGVFSPLEVHAVDGDTRTRVDIERQGVRLSVPGVGRLPALQLDYPWQGRGLFAPRHARLAEDLLAMMRNAESAREAFVRGVVQERRRIARDLHDNLGAQLLSGLYAESADGARDGIRNAISDMRSIVSELTGDEPVPLEDVLARLRHETMERLGSTSIELDWPVSDLDSSVAMSPRVYRNYTAMLRELISNAIRHAQARRLSVHVSVHGGLCSTTVKDDGIGMEREREGGHGLANLRFRASELGGTISFVRDEPGTTVRLELPLTEMMAMESA